MIDSEPLPAPVFFASTLANIQSKEQEGRKRDESKDANGEKA